MAYSLKHAADLPLLSFVDSNSELRTVFPA
jgi:hypothetical protein